MKKIFLALVIIIFSSGTLAFEDKKDGKTNPHAIPDWFIEHIDYLTSQGGIWIADNSQYKSEQEKHDYYASHWQKGIGGKSFTGRLYAITDGKESGTFWEFRAFWHPIKQRVIMQQFGANGSIGLGTLIIDDKDKDVIYARGPQTFFSTSGDQLESGHTFEFKRNEQVTSSYTILSDGSWSKNRSYLWKRKNSTDK